MSKRPELHVIHGGAAADERKIFRLRETRPHEAPAQAWPPDGEWRELVRRLTNNPIKSK